MPRNPKQPKHGRSISGSGVPKSTPGGLGFTAPPGPSKAASNPGDMTLPGSPRTGILGRSGRPDDDPRRIAKAATPPAAPGETYRLEDIDVELVSLVRAGANRQRKFFVVKEDDTAKAVPAADATPEDKRAAQAARATQYGIQALEGADADLSFPADSPTTEALYGDPVNLKYALGGSNNQLDPDRIRAAMAYFKQHAATYTDADSRGKVYGRIIEAALAADIEVSFDPEDAVDALLPQDVKDKLTKAPAPEPADATKDGVRAASTPDLDAWLQERHARVAEAAIAIATPWAAPSSAPPAVASEPAPPAPVGKSGEAPADEPRGEVTLLRKELATLQEQHTREQDRLRAELEKTRTERDRALADASAARAKAAAIRKGIVGGTSAIPAGEVSRHPVDPSAASLPSANEALLVGDVAANVARVTRAEAPR